MPIPRLFFLPLLFPFFTSCTSTFYQVAEVKYSGSSALSTSPVIDHEALELEYSFWAEGGLMRCKVRNQSDQPIVLDLARSSVIINEEVRPYFESSETRYDFDSETWLWDTETAGSSHTRTRKGELLIPPGSFFTLNEIELNYPFLPVEQLKGSVQADESVNFNPAPFAFRHYLTYYAPDTPNKAIHIDDHFEVHQLSWVGRNRYHKRTQDPMAFYGTDTVGGEGAGLVLLVIAGAGLIILGQQGVN